jgi:putative flippase GtrA
VVVLTIAKVIAIAFSLIWNYLWYSRVVFRKKPA